jgi:peptidoglycan/LPS O-acetylase OafA/YrhL
MATTGPAPADPRVFHTLDALRGVAAIGVVVFHMRRVFEPLAAPGGYLAVDLFFMMSGVVLSHAYESRFATGMGALEFMRIRLVRLYPLYILGLLAGIAVTLASMFAGNSMQWDASGVAVAVVLALLFLPNLTGHPVDTLFPLNVPSWSLFLELVLNLLFVALWPLLTGRRLVVATVLAGLAAGVATLHAGTADLGATSATLPAGLARTVFGFGVGVLIARRVRGSVRTESNAAALVILGIVVVAIAARPEGNLRTCWDLACMLLVFPPLVYWGTRIDPGARLRRVATFLGLTSYGIYVLHSPVSAALNSAVRPLAARTGGDIGAPWLGVTVLAILLAGTWLVDRWFDAPVRRWLGRATTTKRMAGRRQE